MLTLLAPHFLIKIPKKAQEEKKAKIGSILIPETCVHLDREIQSGEIVGIGAEAALDFPEAQVGHTLLVHHFTSGKVTEKSDDGTHLIDEDEEFNYYLVTSRSYGGRACECYACYDPTTKAIIPHKEFIFLETEPKKETTSYEKFLNHATTTTTSGLIVFKEWQESREDVTEKNKQIKKRVESLSNIGNMTDEIKWEIHRLEQEMSNNTKKSNKKKYLPYKVAATNPVIEEWFGCKVEKGDIVYCLNIASGTTIEFMGIEYRAVKINYISFPYNYLKKAVQEYRLKTA